MLDLGSLFGTGILLPHTREQLGAPLKVLQVVQSKVVKLKSAFRKAVNLSALSNQEVYYGRKIDVCNMLEFVVPAFIRRW